MTRFLPIAAVALLVALFRPVLLFYTPNEHVQASYEAVAHLLVGGLFAAWYVTGKKRLLRTALALSAVEVVSATIGILS